MEGFDFGVGMIHGVVGRDDAEKRVAINSIGPLWDGNEVWLIVAGAGMFAAFPEWYATMFSSFYLALVLLLVALIVRGVSFEFRGKRENLRWRGNWDALMAGASLVAPLLIGIALGNLLHGLPIDSNHEYTGDFMDLLNPYSVFVGITVVLLCIVHGAAFLYLKTTDGVHERACALGLRVAPLALLAVIGLGIWTQITLDRGVFPGVVPMVAVVATASVLWLMRRGWAGWAFTMSTVAMASTIATIFIDLYPRVMVSSTNPGNSLTIENASSSPYTLKVMTIVALIFFPVVLLYQGWTYYVFRRRVGLADIQDGGPAPAPSAGASGAPAGD